MIVLINKVTFIAKIFLGKILGLLLFYEKYKGVQLIFLHFNIKYLSLILCVKLFVCSTVYFV